MIHRALTGDKQTIDQQVIKLPAPRIGSCTLIADLPVRACDDKETATAAAPAGRPWIFLTVHQLHFARLEMIGVMDILGAGDDRAPTSLVLISVLMAAVHSHSNKRVV
ncbi:hypothetical protein DY245_43645 [Streptomyces inhibens]|uniref:Uncharacterized protein n=2 Tax=Streptomyces inhibens TaxID=2293571 RepID=A0A371PP43_STRIH|nr:hypothetical protein DY245_43645 [Streptomyces inhibens]